ncbi:hypothetical protein CLV51_104100 [Chitinophaga niastensis]|uniref:Carboxypeptidase family protein n=1 Tax=Chitinophaga niastensis TaxID=536980 RepID=A0A2P8HGQ6_CHINA|nr:hypothetical protein [Chitinophaga niastensis]PSL45398.1 hypothetical protein CLV51_104100 [Chitinophaga niastensis]
MKYLIVLLFMVCVAVQKAAATNLRGRIVRYDPYSGRLYPLYNVRVDLWIWNGAQWVTPGYNFTNQDGFYFFVNLSPGYLFKVQVFNIVYPGQQNWTIVNVIPPGFQDIPQITT